MGGWLDSYENITKSVNWFWRHIKRVEQVPFKSLTSIKSNLYFNINYNSSSIEFQAQPNHHSIWHKIWHEISPILNWIELRWINLWSYTLHSKKESDHQGMVHWIVIMCVPSYSRKQLSVFVWEVYHIRYQGINL